MTEFCLYPHIQNLWEQWGDISASLPLSSCLSKMALAKPLPSLSDVLRYRFGLRLSQLQTLMNGDKALSDRVFMAMKLLVFLSAIEKGFGWIQATIRAPEQLEVERLFERLRGLCKADNPVRKHVHDELNQLKAFSDQCMNLWNDRTVAGTPALLMEGTANSAWEDKCKNVPMVSCESGHIAGHLRTLLTYFQIQK